ncbi:M23 family metallopeptidase [Streptomyces griseoviridis]
MRSSRRHPLLVPVLICACVVLAARPGDGDGGGGGSDVSARVARLYAESAVAARHDDRGRQETVRRELDADRDQLQSRADASVAAGACRGAVRLDQPGTRSTGGWVAPVESYDLSAGFGSGGARWARRHTGQDFAVPIGTPVRAVGAGRVVRVSCGGAFGIEVVVRHEGGSCTQYAHLAAVTVDEGERVAAGQWIGQSGTTGNSTGPHLHFEVRSTPEYGSAVDPVPWLEERGVPLGQPGAERG